MENYLELLIFLAFAAFSFFSRFLNKKKKPPTQGTGEYEGYEDIPQPEKPVVDPDVPEKKPVSFEDILREMMGESNPQPAPPLDKPKRKVEKKLKEQTRVAQQTAREAQQVAKKAKRITDKISLEDSGKRIEPIEITPEKNSVAQEVAEALSNPKSAREAIILSEIINRKYF
ncbi:hypothetical protein [Tunicatimonas pelagia]|uniref:hypothetical protein n=1 Tax=Tunicatimonas pelagia TaxID=931531 RepID=UPI00266654C7|nr:hypothetical protein [Tunicatimonas pelagia]WKN42346.1 hypothetical protein P0M28_25250 [Tunicatimonas pelagia]